MGDLPQGELQGLQGSNPVVLSNSCMMLMPMLMLMLILILQFEYMDKCDWMVMIFQCEH